VQSLQLRQSQAGRQLLRALQLLLQTGWDVVARRGATLEMKDSRLKDEKNMRMMSRQDTRKETKHRAV
jgi:hypothetical protein